MSCGLFPLTPALPGQIRRPKVEGRKKAETRRPKPESPSASGFGLRISELGLQSPLSQIRCLGRCRVEVGIVRALYPRCNSSSRVLAEQAKPAIGATRSAKINKPRRLSGARLGFNGFPPSGARLKRAIVPETVVWPQGAVQVDPGDEPVPCLRIQFHIVVALLQHLHQVARVGVKL